MIFSHWLSRVEEETISSLFKRQNFEMQKRISPILLPFNKKRK